MRDELTRRDFLKLTAGASGVVASAGTATVGQQLSTFPYEVQNVKTVPNALVRLRGSSLLDWRYNWSSVVGHVRSSTSLFRGGSDGLQAVNAEEGFVSTPSDGIAVGITEGGRMSTLQLPHTGFTHQIPYYVYEETDPLKGAKPWEGGFGGLQVDGETTWLWEDVFDHEMGYIGDTGILSMRYETDAFAEGDGQLVVDEEIYTLPTEETVVRDLTLRNETDAHLDGTILYQMQANANDNQQNFVAWKSNENRLRADDALRWVDREGPYELLLYTAGTVSDSGAANTGPGGLFGDAARTVYRFLNRLRHIGAEPNAETRYPVLEDVASSDEQTIRGRYLSGYLAADFDLRPGQKTVVPVFVTGGRNPERLPAELAQNRQKRRKIVRDYWDGIVSQMETDAVPGRYRRSFERAVVTVLMLTDPSLGSISASGNLQPTYYPSWPRDGVFSSVALARAGFPEPAKRFLGEFLPSVQEADGSFRQCYDSRGEFAGVIEVENDQQPLYAWAVQEVYAVTGDNDFLETAWGPVRDALGYAMDAGAADGLLTATPDIAEGLLSWRQSLWTNSMAYEGLRSGARLARKLGADPAPYRHAATEGTANVGGMLHERFFGDHEYITAIGLWGPYRKRYGYNAVAIWPSRWAETYGETARLGRDIWEEQSENDIGWMPSSLLAATAFYHSGETDAADAIVEDVLTKTTDAGYLTERMDGEGHHQYGSPLGWASSQFVLALTERGSTPGGFPISYANAGIPQAVREPDRHMDTGW